MKNSEINTTIINGHTLEFIENGHIYVCDGIIVPSITQILKLKFGGKYDYVSRQTLQRAAEKGTAVHAAIENYCKTGEESDFPELRNFKFLQKKYGFKVMANEIPVILFRDDIPVCAGRLDLVLQMDGKTGLADIKRTSTLDKEYLAYQLNLYRIAYQQCYGTQIEFLRGVHLHENVRRFVELPINEDLAWSIIKEYEERKKWL